jgi:ATP phosphoribosyltransferase
MQPGNRIRIALQKTGKLAQGSQDLLQQCGINVFPDKNQLFLQDHSAGVDVFFARDDDIPTFLDSGVCDLGIIGRNVFEEYCEENAKACEELELIAPLGFSKCQLSLAIPKESAYRNLQDLEGASIATSYPNILKKFLLKNNINAKIVVLRGSVELAPKMGIADIICDLVSSGATLRANGLIPFMTVMNSEAVLVSNKTASLSNKKMFFNQLFSRINLLKAEAV